MKRKRSAHYVRWLSMRQRCLNPRNKDYCHYGGRGIEICKEWGKFETFQKWCKITFENGKSLDRMDNDGPYSPENCKWGTPSEQSENRRVTAKMLSSLSTTRLKLRAFFHSKFGNPETRELKTCVCCRLTMALKYFNNDRTSKDGKDARCKACERKRNQKRYQKRKNYGALLAGYQSSGKDHPSHEHANRDERKPSSGHRN